VPGSAGKEPVAASAITTPRFCRSRVAATASWRARSASMP